MMSKNIIEQLISTHGTTAIARVCGVSVPAVYKWIRVGRLPRTEWTGETNYAQKISEFDPGFSVEELLTLSNE